MTEEKWQDVKSMVKDKFKIIEDNTAPLELKTGENEFQTIGQKEIIIFLSPLGKTKLEFAKKPVILDKKEHFSKRMGTSSKTEYILSENEFVFRMEAYLEQDGVWEKIDSGRFEA